MDKREGVLGPYGEWITPERINHRAAVIMQYFDKLPRSVRDHLNEHGTIKLYGLSQRALGNYRNFMRAHREF